MLMHLRSDGGDQPLNVDLEDGMIYDENTQEA